MRYLFLLPVLTLVLHAGESLPERLQKAQRMSADSIRQLQAELALAEGPAEAKAYHEAHLAYLLGARRLAKDPKADLALVERAIQILEPRKDAESRALLGACLGVKIGFAPASGMTLAPKASALFEAALQQNPSNPRVLMLQGVHVLHTPAFFGGGAKAALPILEAAVKAVEGDKTPTDPWAPTWGKAETLVWLAQAQRGVGQAEAATASLQQALALDPTYGHAHALLKAGQ